MLKQIAWNTFKNTGDINTFMELAKVEKAMEDGINDKEKMITNIDTHKSLNELNTIVKQ